MVAMVHDLPTEVLIEILGRLDYRSLLESRGACSALRDVIDRESSLQIPLELQKSGLSYMTGGGLCVDVIQRLQQLRNNWKHLEWTGKYEHYIKGPCNAYELVDGLFVKTDSNGEIIILELPTTQSPTFRMLKYDAIGFRPGDFTLDATQDLIAFLKVEPMAIGLASEERMASLRLLSMSRLHDHPEAAKSTLYFNVISDAVWGNSVHRAVMQIAGDVVGIFVCSGSNPRVVIWNWKNGKLIGDSKHSDLPPGTHSFTFVSPNLFYVTSLDESGALVLYSIDSSATEEGFTHVASLKLPNLQTYLALHSFGCHTEQLRAKKSSRASSTLFPKQLHAFTLIYVDETDFSHYNFRMLATTGLFLDYHALYLTRGANTPVIASWDDWGPFRTRFQAVDTSYHWLRYVHGQRVALPFEDNQIEIWDFNISALPAESKSEIAAPTVLPRDRVFEDMVVSRLPYFEIKKARLEENYHGLMIDNDRLIGLSVEDTLGAAINKVTVYTF